jgi:sigma-B regulation protein RsbU (phosphoserine phosphatase)
MSTPAYDFFRRELLERRRLLETAREATGDPQLQDLLREIDAALDRIADGSFGTCETCLGSIEPERLVCNPLLRYCLDDLNESGRRELQRDLELAAHIQTTMLPERAARFGPWQTFFHFEPLGPVSGDYCDLIAIDGALYFLLGDAAGKGVAASMLMSQLHTLFRALTSLRLRPAELLARANHVLCETNATGRFATVVCGLATNDGMVEIASAGHCPAVLMRNSGVDLVESTGVPLGMFCEASYASRQLLLGRGDGLLLYTDGMIEATDSKDCEYGTNRLLELARRVKAFEPRDAVTACIADVAAFRSSAADDLTVMAIQLCAEVGAQKATNVA